MRIGIINKSMFLLVQAAVLAMSASQLQAREHPEKADIFNNEHPVFSEHPGYGKGRKKGFAKHKHHDDQYRREDDVDDRHEHHHRRKGDHDDRYDDRYRYEYGDRKYDRYRQRYYDELYGMERRRYYDPRDAARAPVDAVIDGTVNKIHRSIDEMRNRAINGVDSVTRKR